jgi:hypothetical protein
MKGHQHACGDRLGRGSWGVPVYTARRGRRGPEGPAPLRMAGGFEFVQRRGQPFQPAIVRDEVEME